MLCLQGRCYNPADRQQGAVPLLQTQLRQRSPVDSYLFMLRVERIAVLPLQIEGKFIG